MIKLAQIILLLVAIGSVVEGDGTLRKVVNGLERVASKGAQTLGNGVEVRIESVVHPPPHQGGKHNIVSSAIRGVGRLLRNVSVGAGKFAGHVGKGAIELSKNTAGAVGQTVKESVNRIATPRNIPQVPVLPPIPATNQPPEQVIHIPAEAIVTVANTEVEVNQTPVQPAPAQVEPPAATEAAPAATQAPDVATTQQAVTEAATVATTTATTEATTAATTEATTVATTEATTAATTDVATEVPSTQSSTESVTSAASTEAATEATTISS